jgi:hypothetical protein
MIRYLLELANNFDCEATAVPPICFRQIVSPASFLPS